MSQSLLIKTPFPLFDEIAQPAGVKADRGKELLSVARQIIEQESRTTGSSTRPGAFKRSAAKSIRRKQRQ